MSKINILSPAVFNRIAAGEVVERPYSVVKELVENAIDAGATEIQIYIEKGGKQLIRVVDNGCGIERDDLHAAYLPHATSKISKADDLFAITTLGFRGEAVASIASVSKMNIISKTENGKCYSLRCDGGEMGEIRENATTQRGTEVCVEMLFYNTPVRLDFLKNDKSEEADITGFVSRFILCRSDIAFTYYVNDKKVLQSFGEGDEDAFRCVYGQATMRECLKINAEKHGIRIRGYIGNQNFFKGNKTYQNVFINGRYVLNNTITSAIMGAYRDYLMKRQYPFCVLHIDMPTEIVDVNVHPNKTDVRFMDNQMIYGCIYSVLSSVLDGTAKAVEYVEEMPKLQETQTVVPKPEKKIEPIKNISESILSQEETAAEVLKEQKGEQVFAEPTMTYEQAQKEMNSYRALFKDVLNENKKGYIPMSEIGEFDKSQIVRGSMQPPSVVPRRVKNAEKLLEKFPDTPYDPVMLEFNDPNYEMHTVPMRDRFAENKLYLESLDKQRAEQGKIAVDECVYAGKLFNTYLMYEYNDDVYIIDQHAAHERLIFDSLKAQMQAREVARQPMLVPFQIRLNAFEATFIREHIDDLWDMGFKLRDWGETGFEVYEIPVDLRDIDLNKFFNEVLSDVNGYRAIKLEDILKDKLASAACKAAVKGGMDITRKEVEELLSKMQGDMTLKCPHGRPVVVKMTKKQIEKMFKRIV